MKRLFLALAFLCTVLAVDAPAQEAVRLLRPPDELALTRSPMRTGSDLFAELELVYAENEIYDPRTGLRDRVHLRSYNGKLVGPTIRMKPGDTLRVKLTNNLPLENCISPEGTHNIPNCFNTTNLHTHGFHISPVGNSDNVLLEIQPGTVMHYEFNLPKDHPSGTFWYHAHRHGSTAIQVSSGMAGALIVEGERTVDERSAYGFADIDTILKNESGGSIPDVLLLFEQIPYACLDKNGNIIENPDKTWACPSRSIGQIEQYGPQFGPGTWPLSGRYTLLNGDVQPTMKAKAGELQRWRLIHGGVRDTIEVRITRTSLTTAGPAAFTRLPQLSTPDHEAWVRENCRVDETIPQFELAVDGLTRRKLQPKPSNTLQPGYRSDALVFFPEPGWYCVIDDDAPASAVVNPEGRERKNPRVLALVQVEGGTRTTGDPGFHVIESLLAANPDLPADVRNRIRQSDLADFSPLRDVAESEITGKQDLVFSIDVSGSNTRFGINHRAYDPDRVDRLLPLGGVEEWRLTSTLVHHPFHIHVNPFQVVRILNPKGQSIIDSTGACIDGPDDSQYCDQIGVFRDTLFVKQDHQVFVRTRYERYIGEYVLHCHILDHEDQGMMQNVKIVPSVEMIPESGHELEN